MFRRENVWKGVLVLASSDWVWLIWFWQSNDQCFLGHPFYWCLKLNEDVNAIREFWVVLLGQFITVTGFIALWRCFCYCNWLDAATTLSQNPACGGELSRLTVSISEGTISLGCSRPHQQWLTAQGILWKIQDTLRRVCKEFQGATDCIYSGLTMACQLN
jgi:hypothetical protein